MRIIVPILLLLATSAVHASAGRVIFSYGDVQVISENGNRAALRKNDEVNAGDLIVTGKNGIMQMRMIDKGFISLRRNSRFKIDSFELGESREQDKGFFSLLKGGFRAITGVIGKRLKAAYRVTTTTATIGIRGTDYTARLCNQDCKSNFGASSSRSEAVKDGLYVGVNQGGVFLTNNLGSLDLDELQYGYVKDAGSAPVALLSAPEFLFFKSRPPDTETEDSGEEGAEGIDSGTIAQRESIEPGSGDINNDSGLRQDTNADGINLSQNDIEKSSSTDQNVTTAAGTQISLNNATLDSNRSMVLSLGELGAVNTIAAVSENAFNALTITSGAVTRFESNSSNGIAGQYTIGSATTLDLGFDPVSGVSWGRWANGSANFINALTQANASVDLNTRSLHWVSSPDRVNIALPTSGAVSYQLVGNTSPTDNLGNTGILGSASLAADFAAMTTSTRVDIGINSQVWNASGSGVIQANGNFTNNLTVTGTDAVQGAFSGQGSSAGFFTNNAAGAGMGYALEATVDNIPTNVTGTAIFQQ